MLDGDPVVAQLARESPTSASAARRSGVRSVICEPTWLWRPTSSRPGAPRPRPGDARGPRRCAMPNLFGLEAGGDVRMAARVDVGIDPQRDARPGPPAPARSRRCVRARRRLGVDRPDAESDRLLELRARLADAGEDDLRRDETGAERHVDLAAGVRVGVAAQAAQQPGDGQRRVRLERVVDGVRMRGEGLRRRRGSALGDGRGAVDVEGRAFRRREQSAAAARRRTRACRRADGSRSRAQ